jgi:hypothetical protein
MTFLLLAFTALLAVLTRAQPLKPAQFMALMTLYNETGRVRCCEPFLALVTSLGLIFVCAADCPTDRCTRFSATSACAGFGIRCDSGDLVRLDMWQRGLRGTITSLIGLFTRLEYLYE